MLEFLEDGRLEPNNLASDIEDIPNIAKENPTKSKELRDRIIDWRAEVKAPIPVKNGVESKQPKKKSATTVN